MSPRHYSILGTLFLCVALFQFTVESFQLRPEVVNWLSEDKPIQQWVSQMIPETRCITCKPWFAWTCTTCGVGLLIQGRAAGKKS